MKKEDILELNRKYSKNCEDEREQYISGKAGIAAKIVFLLLVIIITLFKQYKDIPAEDIKTIFFAYCATECWYKYHHLKQKVVLILSILFTVAAFVDFMSFMKL